MKLKILLIEDDLELAAALVNFLKSEHHIEHSATFAEAKELMREKNFDLILLDKILPDIDGDALLKSLRESKKEIPVIVITVKDSIDEKLKSFEEGADDYLIKPFSPLELLARINAVAKRSLNLPKSAADIRLFQNIMYINGVEIELDKKEAELVSILLQYRGNTVTKEKIFEALWPEDFYNENRISVLVYKIRKKIRKKMGHKSDIIKTYKYIGYKLE